jgi:hypothetical protein
VGASTTDGARLKAALSGQIVGKNNRSCTASSDSDQVVGRTCREASEVEPSIASRGGSSKADEVIRRTSGSTKLHASARTSYADEIVDRSSIEHFSLL